MQTALDDFDRDFENEKNPCLSSQQVRRKLRTLDLVDDTQNKDGGCYYYCLCKDISKSEQFSSNLTLNNKIASTKLLQSRFLTIFS